jgi:CTD kinase subunit beta
VRAGPHPGYITSSNQYTCERKIRHLLKENGCDPAREDNYRLQGVQLIDNVREHLQLYVGGPQREKEKTRQRQLTLSGAQTGSDV